MDRLEPFSDTMGTRFLIEREGEMVCVQGVFVNDSTWTGELTYELDVQRAGASGTTHTTQLGTFDTVPGQTDTLSTVRVNVQSGDHIKLHLAIRQNETLIEEDQWGRTF